MLQCELWFFTLCANVTDTCYKFLCSRDVAWYCKKAVTEYKNFEEKCKEYTKELNQRMKSIEATIQIKINGLSLNYENCRENNVINVGNMSSMTDINNVVRVIHNKKNNI